MLRQPSSKCQTNSTDELQNSSLHLIETSGQIERTYLFRWTINKYEKLITGVMYSCHYIRIGANIHRLKLIKLSKKVDHVSATSLGTYSEEDFAKYIFLGITPHPTKDISFSIIKCNSHMKYRDNNLKGLFPDIPNRKYMFEFRENPGLFTYSEEGMVTLTVELKLVLILQGLDILDVRIEKNNALPSDLEKLLDDGKFYDATIEVDAKTFYVHRCILGARSPVFSAMLSNNMLETQENRIVLKDIDSDSFSSFLRYIYSGRIERLTPDLAMNLLELADKYHLSHLQDDVVEYLSHNLSIDYVLRVLAIADLHNVKHLKQIALMFIARNLRTLLTSSQWLEFRKNLQLVDDILAFLAKDRPRNRLPPFQNIIWQATCEQS